MISIMILFLYLLNSMTLIKATPTKEECLVLIEAVESAGGLYRF